MKKLINNTAGDIAINDMGITVPASSDLEIPISKYVNAAHSNDLITKLSDGSLTYNDGTVSLGLSDALDHIKGYQQKLSLDSDGASNSRFKIAPAGWRLEARFMNFKLGTASSIVNKKADGSDVGDCELKFYNASDEEITTDLATECKRTDLIWKPTYDLYAVGGSAWWDQEFTSETFLHAIMAAGIPAQYGGSVEVLMNANLKILPLGARLQIDGRAPKFLPASPTGANWFRLQIRHAIGNNNDIEMLWELYRQ